MNIGIIREGKIPIDKRVPLSPEQCKLVKEKFPEVNIFVQRSHIRCFKDSEYEAAGFTLQEDMSNCDILLGVKEVPLDELLPKKTYLFFSHTIKKQPYNRELLRTVLARKIRLIDYETLTNTKGSRVIAFGRYAGLVGAYNGILTYGKRYELFDLKAANKCFDMDEMFNEFSKVKLGGRKVVITGNGRVAGGAVEIMEGMGIKAVSPQEFLSNTYEEAVYTRLNTEEYNKTTDGSEFNKKQFYADPSTGFEGDFLKYAKVADILVASAYWDPKAPVLFTKQDTKNNDFKLKVIADVTCDIEGSIPTTKRPSTIENPIYDYNPDNEAIEPAFASVNNITVMAVDNLPCELPRNASFDFGVQLIDNVLEGLIRNDDKKIIERATITNDGKLTEKYQYLENYAKGID